MKKIIKNRFISLFLMLMLLIAMFPTANRIVYAEQDGWDIGLDEDEDDVTAWTSGSGNNLTLHIGGTGKMEDYADNDPAPWSQKSAEITRVIIEEPNEDGGVTRIGNYAFSKLDKLTRAIISSTIDSIGDNSFNGCGNIVVTFREQPEGREVEIGADAFSEGQKIDYIVDNMRLYDENTVVEEGADLHEYNGKTLVWKRYYYPLWVGGTHVTEGNKDNILDDADATASYDPDTKTLTLNGAHIKTGYNGFAGIYYNGTDDLKINLEDESHNSVNNDSLYYSIYSDKKEAMLYISGTGELADTTSQGIYVSGDIEVENSTITSDGINSGKNVIINSGTVTLMSSGSYGIYTNDGTVIIYENATLIASGNTQAIRGNVINKIAGTGWTNEEGTQDKTDIPINTTGASLNYKKVQFPTSNEYPLWVGNIRVSDSNKDNILDDSDATASYDSDTNTLRLNGITIDITQGNQYGIRYAGQDPLKIELVSGSDNNIRANTTGGAGDGIYSENADISIEGNGTLNINQSHGFGIQTKNDKNISITGATIDVIAANGGIYSSGDLLLSNTTLFVQQTWTYDFSLMALRGKNINLKNASVIAVASAGKGIGVRASSDVTIDDGSTLSAVGKGQAIEGKVKNMINGTGWKDTEGTQGQTEIKINSDGQDLSAYKKVTFPGDASDIPDDIDDDTNVPSKIYKLPETGVE